MNKFPRSSSESQALLRAVLPQSGKITVRPMFGNLAAFVAGNMSVGVFGDELFIRLSASDRAELLKNEGAAVFEPVKGRKMREYVVLPGSWKRDPAKVRQWVTKSLEWSSRLPSKKR